MFSWSQIRLRRIAGFVASAFIIIGAISRFVPFFPIFPIAELDAGWQFGMNEALARGMVFGRDVIFTVGPYGSVETWQYHPATDALMMGGSGLLAFAFAASPL